MKNTRWYDKNPDLAQVFEFIQTLDETRQNQVAQDLFQLLVCEFKIKVNEIISMTAKSKHSFTRWYDKNPDLQISFEIIKGFPPQIQGEIISKVIKTILIMYLEEENV